MTALNPAAASRSFTAPDEAFTSLPWGDDTLDAADAPHPVEDVDGIWQIPRNEASGASLLETSESMDPGDEWVMVFALTGLDMSAPYWVVSSGAWLTLVLDSDEFVYASVAGQGPVSGVPYPVEDPAAGIHIIAVSSSTVETLVVMRGQGTIGTAGAGTSAGSSPFTLDSWDTDVAVVGVWLWEETTADETDLLETVEAIYAMLIAGPMEGTPIEGLGVGDIEGAGTLTVGVPFEPPVIAPPTSGGSGVPPAVPPFAVPDGVSEPQVRHVAEQMPVPTLHPVTKQPIDWQPVASISEDIGNIQITVEGTDITWVHGTKTPVPSWADVEPYGHQAATIELPQITAFHTRPTWAAKNANVDIRLVFNEEHGGGYVQLFVGLLFDAGISEDTGVYTLDCIGLLFASDYQLRLPSFSTAPLDLGTAIPRALNGAVSRRHGDMATAVTGILTSVAGGWEPLLTGYVQGLLATAVQGGDQWTVHCPASTPVLEKKDKTTIAWEIYLGQRGVDVSLQSDTSDQTNIIYAEGTNPDGGHWRNARYPNWSPDDTPAYPYVNPLDTIEIGTYDAGTDSGTGVSVWEVKAGVAVDGYFSAADSAHLRRMQTAAGITVDGILGPQSWAMTFDTGANTGTLDGAFIMPVACATEVRPRLYGPDGDDLGPNPAYDPDIVPITRFINYGQGVTLAQGQQASEEIVARDSRDGWYGTVTFEMDPMSKSRYLLRAGENGLIHGVHGEDIVVHVAAADIDSDQTTLRVDTKARDYPTLDAIMDRERAGTDPALQAVQRLLHGQITTDRPSYDAESPAGRMPRHAIFSGLWDVRRIPVGAYGTIVRTEFTTSGSARAFSLAVFGKPITASALAGVVGNPMTTSDETESPWDKHGDALKDLGLLQAWGWKQQPAGYDPRSFSTPAGATAAPVTGRLIDDASWSYASEQSPWLWVATISTLACYVEGRFYGQAE